jgi:hypothetical protein
MLTSKQADFYRTFGFVVLPGFLADRAGSLQAEVDSALRDAYSAIYSERDGDGISGHYLPMAASRTPVSTSLICDDPRFITAAEQLTGGPVIPECPEGVLYFAEAAWHNDDGIGVTGVKFATYFDELTAGNGALRFVPGSHHREQNARLSAYRKRQAQVGAAAYQASIPGYVADTVPGDVIAFDLHVWHSTAGGRDRLAWTVIYQSDPQTSQDRDLTLRAMHDGFEQAFRGFDRERYPIWRDWLDGAAAHPERAPVIERMRQAGVLDQPGALLGW